MLSDLTFWWFGLLFVACIFGLGYFMGWDRGWRERGDIAHHRNPNR